MSDIPRHAFAGRHVLAEFDGVAADLLDDAEQLSQLLSTTLTEAGATVCRVESHRFAPQGVTVLALLAESHASIHTYPERGSAFADVFTCGARADPERAVQQLAMILGATKTQISVVHRGPDTSKEAREPVGDGLTRAWRLDRVRCEIDTDYQQLLIGDTAQGISLFSNGERQSTVATQLIYHEALMVPGMLLTEQLRRVLIIGAGEGVASQLAVAAGAEHVDHVDIDATAVRLCAQYLPYGYTTEELTAAERGTGSVQVHYQDGWQFLVEATERAVQYDLIVIDLPDETPDDAQHNRLYGTDFLRLCAGILTPGGVLSAQAGCPTVWRNDTLCTAWRRWTGLFDTVLYHGSAEHEWAFLSARQDSVSDPVELVLANLASSPYCPETLDAIALRAAAIPPISLRRGYAPGRPQ